ncbi:MAG TPA: hypothetical protein ENK44_02995 [Caldithrix abyssi]|uniref:POTRA domain-containing protein n=1 Tax=Caldithrix abyssi TaxID=187145 RepID=A0A7V4WUT4_CALAY|nr:hypothetical protein [Caldithrix abyssi]
MYFRQERPSFPVRYFPYPILLVILLSIFSSVIFSWGQNSRPVVQNIEFHGDFGLSDKELSRSMRLQPGTVFIDDSVSAALVRLQRQLNAHGFLFARIDSVVIYTDSLHASVTLNVYGHSGQPVKTGELYINGDSLQSPDYASNLQMLKDQPYSDRRIEEGIHQLLRAAAERGHPFARAEVTDVRFRKAEDQTVADVYIRMEQGPPVYIKNIVLRGNTYTKPYVILRELDVRPGQPFRQSALNAARKKLYRLNIFKEVKEPLILSAGEDSVLVQIEVEEGNSTNFDGVIGYIPGGGRAGDPEGYFTGLLHLSFNNLFGTGRGFYVNWEKLDRLSEEFRLEYREPWVFRIPMDLGLRLERIVRDTTYIQWEYRLGASLHIFDELNFLFSMNQVNSFPDSVASREQRLLRNRVINGELGIEYDTRENSLNPLGGLYFKNTYSFGLKTNYGPSYILTEDKIEKKENIQTLKLWFEWYYNVWSNQVFALRLNGRQIKGNNLQITDYFWLGGARSVRGYREKQFSGDITAWASLEYRFVLSRNSRIFLFNDWGFYRNPANTENTGEILMGYGAGVRFDTPLGVLGVDYGLGKNDTFSQGKIHFGIINRF